MRSEVLSVSIGSEGVWVAKDGHGQIVAQISGGSVALVLTWAAAYDKHQRIKFFLQDLRPVVSYFDIEHH